MKGKDYPVLTQCQQTYIILLMTRCQNWAEAIPEVKSMIKGTPELIAGGTLSIDHRHDRDNQVPDTIKAANVTPAVEETAELGKVVDSPERNIIRM